MGEITTAIRSIADIRQLSMDASQRTIEMRGTPDQAGAAEWLFNQLDRPVAGRAPVQHSSTSQYQFSPGADDLVRVFYLTNADFQEAVVAIRTLTEISRVFTYSAQKAMVVRATAAQMAATEWLFEELDKPADAQAPVQNAQSQAYRISGSGDDVVRVFCLDRMANVQALQQVATAMRSIGEIRRMYAYNRPRLLAVRGTAEQIAMAEWLASELNQPTPDLAAVEQSRASAKHEYPLAGSAGVVRIFYLPNAATGQDLQQAAKLISSATSVRVFAYNMGRALVARGAIEQMAVAERIWLEQIQAKYASASR
jgi:hypothetical protein